MAVKSDDGRKGPAGLRSATEVSRRGPLYELAAPLCSAPYHASTSATTPPHHHHDGWIGWPQTTIHYPVRLEWGGESIRQPLGSSGQSGSHPAKSSPIKPRQPASVQPPVQPLSDLCPCIIQSDETVTHTHTLTLRQSHSHTDPPPIPTERRMQLSPMACRVRIYSALQDIVIFYNPIMPREVSYSHS